MLAVNEKSPVFMQMVFTDELEAPLVPTTVEWRLDDKEDGTEIVPWTNLSSPASTMNLTVPGSNNNIKKETSVKEKRMFGIRVDDGLAGEGHAEFYYNVVNLTGPVGP